MERYVCPKCRDMVLTCTTNNRMGYADTPGYCGRHPDIPMVNMYSQEPCVCGTVKQVVKVYETEPGIGDIAFECTKCGSQWLAKRVLIANIIFENTVEIIRPDHATRIERWAAMDPEIKAIIDRLTQGEYSKNLEKEPRYHEDLYFTPGKE